MEVNGPKKTPEEIIGEIRARSYELLFMGFIVGIELGMILQKQIDKMRIDCPWLFEVLNSCIKK